MCCAEEVSLHVVPRRPALTFERWGGRDGNGLAGGWLAHFQRSVKGARNLGSEKYDGGGNIGPGHQRDHNANRPVNLAVVEEGKEESEKPAGGFPKEGGQESSGQSVAQVHGAIGKPLKNHYEHQQREGEGAESGHQVIEEYDQGVQGGSHPGLQPPAEENPQGYKGCGDQDQATHIESHLQSQKTALPPPALLGDTPGAIQSFFQGQEHSRGTPEEKQKREEADSPVSMADADQVLHNDVGPDGQITLEDHRKIACQLEAANIKPAHP